MDNIFIISPSSFRSISKAFGLLGRPGRVMMSPAKVTICLAPPKTHASLIGIV